MVNLPEVLFSVFTQPGSIRDMRACFVARHVHGGFQISKEIIQMGQQHGSS